MPEGSNLASKNVLNRLGALLQHLPLNETYGFETHAFLDGGINVQKSRASDPELSRIYRRLGPEEKTRLFILQPGEADDELKGRLRRVRALHDHDYEALSYVWGTEFTRYMLISGIKLGITSNLDGALRRLRLLDRPRLLWIDAICINQNDTLERNLQVQAMQDIYATARQVVIWLGEAEGSDMKVFDTFRRLRFRLNSGAHMRSLIKLGWRRGGDDKIYSGGPETSILSDREYDRIISVLCREWFRRTWIIQEAASARRALLQCGSQFMAWEEFADICKRLGRGFLPVNQIGGDLAQQSLENITAIETARRSHSGPLSVSLFHILVATSASHCAKDHDKIFGVLGLAKDLPQNHSLLSDYDIPVEEVYEQFAIHNGKENKDLKILSCASGPNNKLPSWVPDWRNIHNPHPFVLYNERTKFAASGGMHAVAWYSKAVYPITTILNVEGKLVDGIAVLGGEPTFMKVIAVYEINNLLIQRLEKSRDWLNECCKLASTSSVYSLDGDEIWRTLTCGLTADAFPAPTRYKKYFMDYIQFIQDVPEKFIEYMNDARGLPKEFLGMKEATQSHALIEASLEKWSSRRRFCTTKEGRLACVPTNSENNDIICVLFGAHVPHVLRRRRDGSFSVIGECYVDDIMHGESLSSDTSTMDFAIR